MAQFVQWTQEIEVGIQEIDEQHKQLVRMLNDLFEVMIGKDPTRDEVARQTLTELLEYTRVHFAVEESLFRIFDYPDYARHKREHDRLKEEVREIEQRVHNGEKRIDSALLIFIKNWITTHIQEEDKRYSPFLLQQGVRKDWNKKSWLGRLWG